MSTPGAPSPDRVKDTGLTTDADSKIDIIVNTILHLPQFKGLPQHLRDQLSQKGANRDLTLLQRSLHTVKELLFENELAHLYGARPDTYGVTAMEIRELLESALALVNAKRTIEEGTDRAFNLARLFAERVRFVQLCATEEDEDIARDYARHTI